MIALVMRVAQMFEYALRLSQYGNKQCIKSVANIG